MNGKNNETNGTQLLTPVGLLDLLTMSRTWPEAEWEEGATPAEMWAFSPTDLHGLTGTAVERVATGHDIYSLLDDARHLLDGVADLHGLALVTWGWAAPIDDGDTAPSQHAQRRRVRLVAVVTDSGMMSRVTFADGADDFDDDNEARGPLSEALRDCWQAVTA